MILFSSAPKTFLLLPQLCCYIFLAILIIIVTHECHIIFQAHKNNLKSTLQKHICAQHIIIIVMDTPDMVDNKKIIDTKASHRLSKHYYFSYIFFQKHNFQETPTFSNLLRSVRCSYRVTRKETHMKSVHRYMIRLWSDKSTEKNNSNCSFYSLMKNNWRRQSIKLHQSYLKPSLTWKRIERKIKFLP